MTNLDCIVTNCVYNDDKCCCKGDIEVKGENAKNTAETCCGSFVEQKKDLKNYAVGEPSKQIDVSCEACKCVFNEDYKCSADHIGIAGRDACSCGETECASFRCGE